MRDCANSHKDSGNSLFSRQLFDEAIAQYSLALDTAPHQDPCRATFFNNRAACFQSKVILCSAISNCAPHTFTKGDFDKCISDCTDSLKVSYLSVWSSFHLPNCYFLGPRLIPIIWNLCCVERVRLFGAHFYPPPTHSIPGIYEQKGDVIEAFTDFEEALKKHPTNPVRFSNNSSYWYPGKVHACSKRLLEFQGYLRLLAWRVKSRKLKC